MATLSKRGHNWYFRVRDHSGRQRMIRGCPDRASTEMMAREVEATEARIRLGLSTAAAESARGQSSRPVAIHIADWRRALAGFGLTPRHIQGATRRVERITAAAGIYDLRGLVIGPVASALARLLADGLSRRTVHHYGESLRSFSKWLHRSGRILEDQLAFLRLPSAPESDRRHRRRALTVAECERLIRATEAGPVGGTLSGSARAMLYRTALATGFRLSELRSLTPASFDLASNPPAVAVEAGSSKRRRRDVQPIPASLVGMLAGFLAGLAPDVPIWSGLEQTHAVVVLRRDLDRAGIPYRDGTGRVADFHSLRVSYISHLAASGAPVKTVQALARHSTPSLTLNTYTDLGILDPVGAVESLPVVGLRPEKERQAG